MMFPHLFSTASIVASFDDAFDAPNNNGSVRFSLIMDAVRGRDAQTDRGKPVALSGKNGAKAII
jgi:hypothetical protein